MGRYTLQHEKVRSFFFGKHKWRFYRAFTCIAVRAATIAGLPNPCDMREKWVRCLCMLGSRMCCGRVLQSGDLSWFRRSISSLVICLRTQETFSKFRSEAFPHSRAVTKKPHRKRGGKEETCVQKKKKQISVIYHSPTWWHEEVPFSCRNPAARNAAGWDIRRLVSRGIRFRKRSRSLGQGEWLLLKKTKRQSASWSRPPLGPLCKLANICITGRWKTQSHLGNFIYTASSARGYYLE